ncbi:MAG: hypothetical protein IPH04_14585 [Saprospirales bacterium]|nr:hypothetical protein [Saprospirales bacterium]
MNNKNIDEALVHRVVKSNIDALKPFFDALNEVIGAAAKKIKWTPFSEKLPAEHGQGIEQVKCLFCTIVEGGEPMAVFAGIYTNFRDREYWENCAFYDPNNDRYIECEQSFRPTHWACINYPT